MYLVMSSVRKAQPLLACPVSSIYIQTDVNTTQSYSNCGCSIVETERGIEIGRKREGWSL